MAPLGWGGLLLLYCLYFCLCRNKILSTKKDREDQAAQVATGVRCWVSRRLWRDELRECRDLIFSRCASPVSSLAPAAQRQEVWVGLGGLMNFPFSSQKPLLSPLSARYRERLQILSSCSPGVAHFEHAYFRIMTSLQGAPPFPVSLPRESTQEVPV